METEISLASWGKLKPIQSLPLDTKRLGELMTSQIVRTGDKLWIEIPEELVLDAGFQIGEPLEWVPDGSGGLMLMRPEEAASHRSRPRTTIDEMTLE